MASKLELSDLTVTSFQTSSVQSSSVLAPAGESWPAVCTCINICAPTEDVYCGGGGGPPSAAVAIA
jgi:hypothetical protein